MHISSDTQSVIWKSVHVTDMTAVDKMSEVAAFSFPCRCGDVYVVSEEQLLSDVASVGATPNSGSVHSVLVPCASCSLRLQVEFDVDVHLDGTNEPEEPLQGGQ